MLHRQIIVWRRISEVKAVRYVCFERISSSLVCVSSADYYTLPLDAAMLRQHESQLAELFIEADLDARCDWSNDLESAIQRHEEEFEPLRRDLKQRP